MKPLTVFVPLEVQTSNKWVWKTWYSYDSEKRKWFKVLSLILPPRDKAPETLAHVEVTAYRKRLLDEDNLIGGCKPIFDYLVRAKYIKDDSPHYLKRTITQKKDSSPITKITIRYKEQKDERREEA